MLFGTKIRALREAKGLVLRKVAAQLDIDTATLSKIELGERNAKRDFIPILAKLLDTNETELTRLWLAEKVYHIIEDEEQGLTALKEAESQYKQTKKK